MQGLALKNVRIKVVNQKKKVAYEGFGELLFTHFGLSGPLILSASAHLTKLDKNQYTVIIDLKPALEEKKLDERLVREFQAQANKDFQNALGSLLPRLMIPVIIERTGIPPETKVHDLTRSQRRQLLEQLKGFRVDITGLRPVEEAIVTSGGIKTSEVNPTTMESKKSVRPIPGRGAAGCGRLHRRVQPTDRLGHRLCRWTVRGEEGNRNAEMRRK